MCGIFGYVGSKAPDMNAIKILGLYNESRGKDSCGISIDGNLTKGVDDNKLFEYFITNNVLPKPKNDFTVIGHARAATGTTAHSAENAHPFLIGEGAPHELVFSHNGVIYNIWDLCDRNKVEYVFGKVDSMLLGNIIHKKKSFKVLEQYKGYAALAFYDRKVPNSLYLYKGASNDKDNKLESERPLFYLETKFGMYYSSMANPLFAIRESDKQTVYILEPNVVHYYEGGKLIKDFPIRRPADINEEKKVLVHGHGHGMPFGGRHNNSSACCPKIKKKDKVAATGKNIYIIPSSNPVVDKSKKIFMSDVKFDPFETKWFLKENKDIPVVYDNDEDCFYLLHNKKSIEILHEPNPQKKKKGLVYYYDGRYFRNGHLLDGEMYVNEGGEYEYNFPTLWNQQKKDTYKRCFFFRGVMFMHEEAYESAMKIVKTGGKKMWREANFAHIMSRFAMYPIKNQSDEGYSADKQYRFDWWWNGHLPKSGTYVPYLSDFVLQIVDIGKIFPIQTVKYLADKDKMSSVHVDEHGQFKLIDETEEGDGYPDFPANIMVDEITPKMKNAIMFMFVEQTWKVKPEDVGDEEMETMYLELITEWDKTGLELGEMCALNWGIPHDTVLKYVDLMKMADGFEEYANAEIEAEEGLNLDEAESEDGEEPDDKAIPLPENTQRDDINADIIS